MKKLVAKEELPTCRWMPGTNNSLCNRTDRPMVGYDDVALGPVTCEDCQRIEHTQEAMHRARLGSTPNYPKSPEVEEDDTIAYEAWLARGRYERRHRWLIALDQWYPNYNIAYISAGMGRGANSTYYIGISGGDDHCCNLLFKTKEEALIMWERIPEIVDMQTLLDLGFQF